MQIIGNIHMRMSVIGRLLYTMGQKRDTILLLTD